MEGKFYPKSKGYSCKDCGKQTIVFESHNSTDKRCFDCAVKYILQQIYEQQNESQRLKSEST